MALVRTFHNSTRVGDTGTDRATSPLFIVPANSILIAAGTVTIKNGNDNTADFSVSASNGLTFFPIVQKADTISYSTVVKAWYALVGSSPTSGTVTVYETDSDGCYGMALDLFSYTGYDTGSPIGVKQGYLRGSGYPDFTAGDGPWTIALSGSGPATTSELVAVLNTDSNSPGSAIPGAGWTEIADPISTVLQQVQVRTGSTSISASWDDTTDVTGYKNVALLFEVKAASDTTSLTYSATVISGSYSVSSPNILRGNTYSGSANTISSQILAPEISGEADHTATFCIAELSIPAPTIVTGTSISFSSQVLSGSYSIPSPSISLTSNKVVVADSLSASYSNPAPSINLGWTIPVGSLSGSLSLGSQQVNLGNTVTIGALSGSFGVESPGISVGTTIPVPSLSGAYSLEESSIGTGISQTVLAGSLSGSYALPGSQINTDARIQVETLSGSLSVLESSTNTGVSTEVAVFAGSFGLESPSIESGTSQFVQVGILSGSTTLENPSIEVGVSQVIQVEALSGSLNLESPAIETSSSVAIEVPVLSGTLGLESAAIDSAINIIVTLGFFSGILALENPSITSNSTNVQVFPESLFGTLDLKTPKRVRGKLMPILTRIDDRVQSMVRSMTVSSGFNFDYTNSSFNEFDVAKISFPGITSKWEEEKNQNRNTNDSYLYCQQVNYTFEVYVQKDFNDPTWTAKNQMNLHLDDFKQLFSDDPQLAGLVKYFAYDSSDRVYSMDENNPSKLVMKFEVEYYQEVGNVTRTY